jgi:hypothetical protein
LPKHARIQTASWSGTEDLEDVFDPKWPYLENLYVKTLQTDADSVDEGSPHCRQTTVTAYSG